MLDFPASPTNGQKYPTTSIPGVPTYTWDGEKWVTVTNVSGGGGGGGSSSIIISDTPPTGVPDGTLWWESDSGLLYIRYNDGTSTQWVIAAPQPDVNAFVQYGVQSPTVAQQIQARQNVYAAPLDALAYNGMQFNGSMAVSQERGTNLASTAFQYVVDGIQLVYGGTGVLNVAQYGSVFPGFANCIIATASPAQPSIGANDYFMLWHPVEGYRIARLAWGTPNAQPITIGFWSAHNRPGTYSVTVRNRATNRGYATTYTQAFADIAQFNVVTIPGDTSGTWAIDNTTGMIITFAIAMGSSNTASVANAWITTACAAAPGQVNGVATTSDVFRFTGLVVLPGIEAPSAARSPLIMRPFDQELATCRRYYQNWGGVPYERFGMGTQVTATSADVLTPFVPIMRAIPTMSIIGVIGDFALLGSGGSIVFLTGLTGGTVGSKIAQVTGSVTGGLTPGHATEFFIVNANSRYVADARL